MNAHVNAHDMCIGIDLGLLIGKFHKFFTELSGCHTIVAGYYHFMFMCVAYNFIERSEWLIW